MTACPVCGIDEPSISLGDATDAIRTFPRRYREALADVPHDLLGLQLVGEASSMLGHAVLAREVLELLDGYLPVVLAASKPTFPPIELDDSGDAAERRPSWAVNADLALAGIAAACDDLVAKITDVPLGAWDRAFTIGDDRRTAIWIPRHAAHEGAHHLRDIARVRAALVAAFPELSRREGR